PGGHRPELQGRGRSPPRGRHEHQAPHRDRLVPGASPPAEPAGPGSANEDERPPAARAAQDRRRPPEEVALTGPADAAAPRRGGLDERRKHEGTTAGGRSKASDAPAPPG